MVAKLKSLSKEQKEVFIVKLVIGVGLVAASLLPADAAVVVNAVTNLIWLVKV